MIYCLNPDCQKPRNPDSAKICRSCGAKLRLKDRYRATAAIGQGGFGRTFLAIDEDKPSKPRCVIKQFLPIAQTPQHLKKAANLFQQEAVRLEELGHHPQIPELLAYFSQDGQQYLVQEFIHGKNLADLLSDRGPFSETQIRELLASLLPVLDFVHSHNVIHRDIKPGNIISAIVPAERFGFPLASKPDWTSLHQVLVMETDQGFRNIRSPFCQFSEWLSFNLSQPFPDLTQSGSHGLVLRNRCQQLATQFARYASLPLAQRQYLVADATRLLFDIRQLYEARNGHGPLGRLVLVDFGAAKSLKGLAPLNTGTTIGSPEYVAPEQARGKAVFSSDLYSLGVMCIHLLTQLSPYDLFDSHNSLWVWRNYLTLPVSDRLGHILDKLLEAAIPRRYQSAAEVLHDLDPASVSASLQPSPSSPPPPLPSYPSPPHYSPSPSHPSPSHPLTPYPSLQPSFRIARRAARIAPPPPLDSPGEDIAAASTRRRSPAGWRCLHTFESPNRIYAIALSPHAPLLASSSGNAIKLWDIENFQPLRTLTGHLDIVPALRISPDGKLLISGSTDKLISLWELPTGKRLANLPLHADTVLALAISPKGDILASSSFFDPITLYNLNTGQTLHRLLGHSARIDALAFSPGSLSSLALGATGDGYVLASGSGDRTIKLWDMATGAELRTLEGHSQHISAIAFSPDGSTLASASWDGTVKLWNLKTRRHRTLNPEAGRVNGLTFSPDGKKIAIACDSIQIWTLPSGKKTTLDSAHTDAVIAVVFGTEDRLISASSDRTIKLWQYKP